MKSVDFNTMKEKGNSFFTNKDYKLAIECYIKSLDLANTNEEKIVVLSNIS